MKNIKNVKHIDKLKSLGYSLNEMLIVGSGTMALYGLKENNDIDLWVSKKVLSKMKNDKRFTKNVKNFWQAYDGLIEAEGILICSTGNFEENIKRATIVNGFHFQSLQDVLDWKKCMNRPKDHEHIKMIEAYMIPYKVNKSKISGKGIFATRDIEKDENLGIAFIKVSNTGIPDKDFKRTELGTFVNHSDKPNLKVEKTNKEYLYIALKNIKNGEELTVDYKKFDFEGERGFLENGLISLDKFDEKFLKTIKDWENIGYAPEKWPGKWYTIIYNEQKAGITGAVIINDSHFFQIAIHPNFRGMGLLKSSADLLAKKLNIKKLYATVWLDNKASYKSHINAGFKEMPKDRIEYLKKIGKLENGSTRLYKDFSDHSVVENYLQRIQEELGYNNPSMPNPYDYQSLELDPNVTKQDLIMLGKQLQKMKDYEEPENPLDPYKWVYCPGPKYYNTPCPKDEKKPDTFVVIDNGKRVAIVSCNQHSLIWASWVPGHLYAVRGTMKMLEYLVREKGKFKKGGYVLAQIYHKNTPSLKVSKKLKMSIRQNNYGFICELKAPFWWIKEETDYDEQKEFQNTIKKFKKKYGWDLSYMKLKISNIPINRDGTVNSKMKPEAYGGSHTNNKIIYVGDSEHLKKVLKYYKVENTDVKKFLKILLAHELAHEVYQNILSEEEKKEFKEIIDKSKFRTVYTDTVKDNSKIDVEKFCEYIASQLVDME